MEGLESPPPVIRESTFDSADLRIAALRLVATRNGHVGDEDSLRWAAAQRYIELLPSPAGVDPLWAFTDKGLDLTDSILTDGGRHVRLDGAGSFERID